MIKHQVRAIKREAKPLTGTLGLQNPHHQQVSADPGVEHLWVVVGGWFSAQVGLQIVRERRLVINLPLQGFSDFTERCFDFEVLGIAANRSVLEIKQVLTEISLPPISFENPCVRSPKYSAKCLIFRCRKSAEMF